MDEVRTLRLQVVAALTVIPMISKLVAFREDRQALVADMVSCWLALPTSLQEEYAQIGSPGGYGVTYFGWEYVDAVEADSQDQGGQKSTYHGECELLEDEFTGRLWERHLDLVKARLQVGAGPDEQWLARFPLYSHLPAESDRQTTQAV